MTATTILLTLGCLLSVLIACVLIAGGNWQLALLVLGVMAGVLWFAAVEFRWPQRVRISHLKWRLRHLDYTMDKTTAEMVQWWHEDPGGDEWHALNHWLGELQVERVQLRHRIEDLVYRLGRDTY